MSQSIFRAGPRGQNQPVIVLLHAGPFDYSVGWPNKQRAVPTSTVDSLMLIA